MLCTLAGKYGKEKKQMRREVVLGAEIVALAAISQWVFGIDIKRRARQKRLDVPPEQRSQLQVDHRLASYAGGGDDEGNAQARTLVEHAIKHVRVGVRSRGADASANFCAAKTLTETMNTQQLAEFNERLVKNKLHRPFHTIPIDKVDEAERARRLQGRKRK